MFSYFLNFAKTMNSAILQYNKYNYTNDEPSTSTITTTVAKDLHDTQFGKLIHSITPPLAQSVCNGPAMLDKHAISSNISLPWTLNPVPGISLNLKHILLYPLVISNPDNTIMSEIKRRMKTVESGEGPIEDTVLDGWKVSTSPPRTTRPSSGTNALDPPVVSPERLYIKSGITMTLFKEILNAYAGTLEYIDVTIIADKKSKSPTEPHAFRLPQLITLKITSSVPLEGIELNDMNALRILKLKIPGQYFDLSSTHSWLSFDPRGLRKIEMHCDVDINLFAEFLQQLTGLCFIKWRGCISGSATTVLKKDVASKLNLQVIRIDCTKNYEDLLEILILSNSMKKFALRTIRLDRI
ncbi:hypothetical protein BDQ17DRAFT_1542229 [Cyathus striatus]|nr:hypothetical protein BDQ17DRAFT_1542229 [Cyathus striatus]